MRRAARRFYGGARSPASLPDLVSVQTESFEWLVKEGIAETLSEFSFTDGGDRVEIRLLDPAFLEPALSPDDCLDEGATYEARLICRVRMNNLRTGEVVERSGARLCMMPMMTPDGSFIISGSRRVVVSQFVRAPGVYFFMNYDPKSGEETASSIVLPQRGARLNFNFFKNGALCVRVDNGRRLNAAVLLGAMGFFQGLHRGGPGGGPPLGLSSVDATLEDAGDTLDSEEECLLRAFSILQPGSPASARQAREWLSDTLTSENRYSLGDLGRRRLDAALYGGYCSERRTLAPEDVFAVFIETLRTQVGRREPDDVDHLGNRRVRRAGELICEAFSKGLADARRATTERFLGMDDGTLFSLRPDAMLSLDPVARSVRRFFSSSPALPVRRQLEPAQ